MQYSSTVIVIDMAGDDAAAAPAAGDAQAQSIWPVEKLELGKVIAVPARPTSMSFHGEGRMLAVGHADHSVSLLDVVEGKVRVGGGRATRASSAVLPVCAQASDSFLTFAVSVARLAFLRKVVKTVHSREEGVGLVRYTHHDQSVLITSNNNMGQHEIW